MGNGDQNMQATREKGPIVEISHIGFIFGDEPRGGVCVFVPGHNFVHLEAY